MPTFRFEGIKIEDAPKNVLPKCPKCDKRLDKIWIKTKGTGIVEQKQIVMCPYCETLLGYGTMSL
ncbi:MAG TPA: hypothetical protein PKM43_00500 [Verrucomicrobiota bacterium]|nr:hypothetical protein [Verrucomicrobiota bacterium]HRZ37092.1 hypothetical protein [Candidatus Paceibacterota bacterium]HRZ55713.1 hypothetical protein [Candidatus Paceibacterota bacterium]